MKRETILSRRMDKYLAKGYVLYEYADGQASFDKRSKSGRIVQRLKKRFGNVKVIVVVGAKRHYASEGTKNAIMYKSARAK